MRAVEQWRVGVIVTEKFKVEVGLQGSILSPFLFTLVIGSTVQSIGERGQKATKLCQGTYVIKESLLG